MTVDIQLMWLVSHRDTGEAYTYAEFHDIDWSSVIGYEATHPFPKQAFTLDHLHEYWENQSEDAFCFPKRTAISLIQWVTGMMNSLDGVSQCARCGKFFPDSELYVDLDTFFKDLDEAKYYCAKCKGLVK